MDINSLNSFIDFLRVEKGAAKNTVDSYRRDLTRYINWISNNPDGTIKEYALSLEGLAPSSLERNFSALRSFHKYLNREIGIADPTGDLPESGKRNRLPKALTVSEMSSILESARRIDDPISLRDYLLIELLYSTGARISEVIDININDINQSEVGGETISTLKLRGKGGKERIVPLGSYAKKAIEDYLVRTRPSLLKKGSENVLFLNIRGSRLSRVSASEIVKRAANRAGLETRVTPHVFRHSYATRSEEHTS